MSTVIKQPSVTANIISAVTSVAPAAQKVLFVGQKIAGTAVSGALVTNIQNDNSWDTLFGATSMLAKMIRDARALNGIVQFDAIGLDDAAGVAASGSFAITGPATEDGVLSFIIGSKKNHKYDVTVTDGDTATEIGDALDVLVAADTKRNADSANTTGTVAVTALNDGTLGNFIGLKVEGIVAGVAVVITGMASGATDPTLTNVFDVIGENRYQTIIWPYSAALTELTTLLDARFNSTNDVLDGIGISTLVDSYANLLTALNAQNSQSLAMLVDETISRTDLKGPAQLEFNYSKSAQFGAIRSLRLEADADIADIVISRNGSLDSFGGPALASKPYFNTPFVNLPQIDVEDGFNNTEIEGLHDAGGFVLGNNISGTSSIAGEVVTTYKTDSASNPDLSFKYMNYVDTISTIREYFYSNLRARFAQTRLTEGDLIRGRDMANAELIEAYCTQLHTELSESGFVLTQAGEDALQFFISNLIVTLDLSTGTATVTMKEPIVTQLRTILATIQIAFSTEG